MHPSRTRAKPNQSRKANNRAARQRATRQSSGSGQEIIQARGVPAKGASRRANKKNKGG